MIKILAKIGDKSSGTFNFTKHKNSIDLLTQNEVLLIFLNYTQASTNFVAGKPLTEELLKGDFSNIGKGKI